MNTGTVALQCIVYCKFNIDIHVPLLLVPFQTKEFTAVELMDLYKVSTMTIFFFLKIVIISCKILTVIKVVYLEVQLWQALFWIIFHNHSSLIVLLFVNWSIKIMV